MNTHIGKKTIKAVTPAKAWPRAGGGGNPEKRKNQL